MNEGKYPELAYVRRLCPRYQCDVVNATRVNERKPTNRFVGKQHL